MNNNQAALNSLIGSLVADAASLGLHWIYDVSHINEIAKTHAGDVAFIPAKKENYDGVKAYFAHGIRSKGMMTQYGETLKLTTASMNNQNGLFETTDFQQQFVKHFGMGGTYHGYIDHATSGTVLNIMNDQINPSGIDDDQLPALSKLPAIVAVYKDSDNFIPVVEKAIKTTSINQQVLEYGQSFAKLLAMVLNGEPLIDSMKTIASNTNGETKSRLEAALQTSEKDPVKYGEITGRACQVSMAIPLCFHILTHSNSYKKAIENNILAGGDSAGRSIIIGSIMAAIHGVGTENGIPIEWLLQLDDNSNILQQCHALLHRHNAVG